MLPVITLAIAFAAAQPGAHPAPAALRLKPQAVNVRNAAVSPATLTFTAISPDTSPVVSASASAVVTWSTTGNTLTSWNLKVIAPAAFSSCPTIPASAVTVSCSALNAGNNATCGSNAPLSTTPVQMATGTDGTVSSYSVTLNFTLQDSWQYIASSSCSLAVSYTITAN
jgi:hypothetical protein